MRASMLIALPNCLMLQGRDPEWGHAKFGDTPWHMASLAVGLCCTVLYWILCQHLHIEACHLGYTGGKHGATCTRLLLATGTTIGQAGHTHCSGRTHGSSCRRAPPPLRFGCCRFGLPGSCGRCTLQSRGLCTCRWGCHWRKLRSWVNVLSIAGQFTKLRLQSLCI